MYGILAKILIILIILVITFLCVRAATACGRPPPATCRLFTAAAGAPTPPIPRGTGEPPPARAHRSREHVCRLHRRTAEPPGLGPPLPRLNAHTALATYSTSSPSARLARRPSPTGTRYTSSQYTHTHTHTHFVFVAPGGHTHGFCAGPSCPLDLLRLTALTATQGPQRICCEHTSTTTRRPLIAAATTSDHHATAGDGASNYRAPA